MEDIPAAIAISLSCCFSRMKILLSRAPHPTPPHSASRLRRSLNKEQLLERVKEPVLEILIVEVEAGSDSDTHPSAALSLCGPGNEGGIGAEETPAPVNVLELEVVDGFRVGGDGGHKN